jgi:hypothetical protein
MSLLNVTPAQEEKKASALENAAKVLGVLGSLTQQGMGIAQTMGGLPMFSGAGGAAQAADAAGGVADALQAGGQLANPPQTIQGGWDWRPRVSPNQNMIG